MEMPDKTILHSIICLYSDSPRSLISNFYLSKIFKCKRKNLRALNYFETRHLILIRKIWINEWKKIFQRTIEIRVARPNAPPSISTNRKVFLGWMDKGNRCMSKLEWEERGIAVYEVFVQIGKTIVREGLNRKFKA